MDIKFRSAYVYVTLSYNYMEIWLEQDEYFVTFLEQ